MALSFASDALDAYAFDEKDSTKPTFHGAPMKGSISLVSLKICVSRAELKRLRRYFSLHDVARAIDDDERKARHEGFMAQELPEI